MYSDAMGRTQVYLGDAELALLKDAEERTGASRSELIRRAVQASYGQGSIADKVAALQHSAGAWSDRDMTGAAYVDEIRGDINERLARFGS